MARCWMGDPRPEIPEPRSEPGTVHHRVLVPAHTAERMVDPELTVTDERD